MLLVGIPLVWDGRHVLHDEIAPYADKIELIDQSI